MTTQRPTFNVLGSLVVRTPLGDRPVPGRMPQTILAALLARPDHTLTVGALTDTLWPDRPPPSATTNVRTHISRLRTFLNAHALPQRIHTRPDAYHLAVDRADVDLSVFHDLADRARDHWRDGDAPEALGTIARALDLWRGAFLADLPDNLAWTAEAARATARRDALAELATGIHIHTGHTAEAIADLRARLATDPLHEGSWHNLILALHADGRTAEALAAYSQARTGLRTELGIEPGPRLRAALDTVLGRTDTPDIHQLPIDAPHYTGRTAHITALTDHLSTPRVDHTPPPVATLTGPPGAGKTALAVHTAHRLTDYFPDGRLYIELQGTGDHPVDPAGALSDALGALGVPGPGIPKTLAAKAALYRSHLATRRILVVLDDAADAAQAAPLLPGTGPSAVIVTSRGHLTGLPTTLAVTVDALTTAEATELFTSLTRPAHHTPDQREHTTAVLRSCGHLPLAITIAAARLSRNPTWTPRDLAHRLDTERHRLDELRAGDLDVRTSLALSYRHLPRPAASAFRRLGLLGETTLPAWTAAALADPVDGPDPLETLLDTFLVQPVTDHADHPRIRLHDLLRCFAREQAETEAPAERTAAVGRLLDTWLALTTAAAADMPVPFFGVPLDPAASPPPHPVGDPLAWYDTEHANLITAVDLAVAHGLDAHAWRIAAATAPYFDLRGRYDAWTTTHRCALTATERSGDRYGHAVLTRNLGQAHLYQDRYAPAREAFDTALAIFTDLDDTIGRAVTLSGLGALHRVTGEHTRALVSHHGALALFHTAGDGSGEALVRMSIGRIHLARDDHREARHWFATALDLAEAVGDDHRRAQAMHRLAHVEPDHADGLLDAALAILDGLGDHHCAAYVRQTIGERRLYTGDIDAGRSLLVDSLRVQVSLGDRSAAGRIAALLREEPE
ncbi:BTAD domain-containing putative transcriptional regulator [Phytomonospora sp. NPDC050363]|uniref:AfsR/SARP family transcriptional regulator n=1 Tax=Phytomonospora sp. NPDC050363 TaxID=3155642 RepID=UPI0033E75EA1